MSERQAVSGNQPAEPGPAADPAAAAVAAAEAAVHVTCQPRFAGTEAVEVHKVVRGELGEPNLAVFPQLPDRGVWARQQARSTAMITELGFDLQPHGWRIGVPDGMDARRARSLLRSDENLLADVLGAEKKPAARIKLNVLGPWSLAAGLHLGNGERAVADHGARRDIIEAYAQGLGDWLTRLSRITALHHFTVQLEEPALGAVLDGALPTASGYRTLRSVPRQEVRQLLGSLVEHVNQHHNVSWVAQLAQQDGRWRERVDLVHQAGIDALVLDPLGLDHAGWERAAALVESGGRLFLQVLEPGQKPPGVVQAVKDILRPWRMLGLGLERLGALRLMPRGDFSASGAAEVISCLQALTGYAQALEQTRVDA